MIKLASRLAASGLVVALLGLLTWSLLHPSDGSKLVRKVASGARPIAPAFHGKVIWNRVDTWPTSLSRRGQQKQLALSELRGSIVVLNFWASWCHPCNQEAKDLSAAAYRYRGKVAFIGINPNDLRSFSQAFLTKYALPFPSVSDPGGRIATQFGVTQVPETYFIAANGRIIGHIAGPVTAASVQSVLAPALSRS
jgi:cytochrome c biogenesis protein CcmG/thiol:disulfide interchange protein DsbE